MERDEILRSMFSTGGLGLEIGPSYNPLLPKAKGFNVEVLDHASQSDLIEKYRHDPKADHTRIEPVDYVCDGRSFTETIGAKGRYDFIVASHVIEHAPDLIGFLHDCEALLRPNGVLVLAVPDKRYCFDTLRPVSTTGAALQAYHEHRSRHAAATVFDHMSFAADRGGQSGWHNDDWKPLVSRYPLKEAKRVYEAALTGVEYVDMHAWCFTPSSFRLLLKDFNDLGLLEIKERALRPTDWFEFFVVLSRDGAGCTTSRFALMQTIATELSVATDEVARLKSEINTLRFDAARMDVALAAAQAREEYLRSVLASTSWRLTAPLRALGTLWKRLRGTEKTPP